MKNRLLIALGFYVFLGVLAWQTLENDRVRLITLLVLGMFAVRTLVAHVRQRREAEEVSD